jgi:Cd2+/Zn2+-exporting ATPase/Cu+-exporting ATPase
VKEFPVAVLEDPPVRPGLADQSQARTTVTAAEAHGYRDRDDEHDHEHVFDWWEAARIAFVALAAAAVWFRVWEPLASANVIGVVGLIVGGWPIFKEAAENIVARRMTMELSMSIAIIAAAAIGEFFTALVITLFVLVAEVLEGMTVSRGRKAIGDLLDFLPRSVSVRRAGAISDIHADELKVGDAVLVNPGGRVPVDGTVLSGHSFLDQARITGESMPVEKTAGAPVYAGSINQSGALEIRAEGMGREHRATGAAKRRGRNAEVGHRRLHVPLHGRRLRWIGARREPGVHRRNERRRPGRLSTHAPGVIARPDQVSGEPCARPPS